MSSKRKEKDEDLVCPPPPLNVTHPLRYYELTPEELRALEDCDRESFYRRCLPLSALLAVLTHAGVRKVKKGAGGAGAAVFWAVAAAGVGHVAGRAIYIPECRRRLSELPPTSHLGRVMRKYHCESECSCKKR